jgi:hypothetical protein
MFELIRILIEQISKHIDFSAVLRARKEDKLADIGVDLFALYLATNRIYITGQDILREVSQFRNFFEKWKSYNASQERVETRLKEKVAEQCTNIREFYSIFERRSGVAAVIDPEFARKAGLLAEVKGASIFDCLIAAMSQGSHLFSSSMERQLSQLMSVDFSQKKAQEILQQIRGIQADSNCTKETIRDLGSFDVDSLTSVEKYIDEMKPAAQLESLRVILDGFHETLTTNFEVRDILLRVGERRSFP